MEVEGGRFGGHGRQRGRGCERGGRGHNKELRQKENEGLQRRVRVAKDEGRVEGESNGGGGRLIALGEGGGRVRCRVSRKVVGRG